MFQMLRWIKTLGKIELRNLIANPIRSCLTAALIALPVAAVVCGLNLAAVTQTSQEEFKVRQMGAADILVPAVPDFEKLKSDLPPGAVIELVFDGRETVFTNGLRINVASRSFNLDGLASGIAIRIAGRSATSPTEIEVSSALAETCKIKIEDFDSDTNTPVHSIESITGQQFDIVGIVEIPEELERLVLFHPYGGDFHNGSNFDTSALIGLPAGVNAPKLATTLHPDAVARSALRQPDSSDLSIAIFIVGVFAFAEAALIVSATFIVGIRRRQREIGLLASSGASPKQVVVSILLSATLLALFAGIVGTIFGLVVAWGLHPWLDGWNGRRNGAFRVSWVSHFVVVFMGVVTAVLAAMIPAFKAGKMSIKSALSSRRPSEGRSSRWGAVGLTLVVVAIGVLAYVASQVDEDGQGSSVSLAWFIVIASILGMVGFGLCSSLLLQLAAFWASKFPLSSRLALRELGRFRSRNGPIVFAILAAMSLCILVATIYQSVQYATSRGGATSMSENQIIVNGPSALQATQQIAKSFGDLPFARMVPVRVNGRNLTAGDPDQLFFASRIAVTDEDGLAAFGVDDPDGLLSKALASGKLVCLHAGEEPSNQTPVFGADLNEPIAHLETVVASGTQNVGPFGFLISDSTVEANNWHSPLRTGGDWLINFREKIGSKAFSQAAAIAGTFPQTSVDGIASRRTSMSPMVPLYLISLLTGLLVITIATALSSVEAKVDQQILKIVGAPPSVYRNQAAARSGILALFGCALAIPAGILPACGLIALVPGLELAIPWSEFAAIVAGLPVAAFLLTWIFMSLFTSRDGKSPKLT